MVRRISACLLCLSLVFALCACGSTASEQEETKKVDNYKYPQLHDKLTWEKINEFPIKDESMSVAQMRQLCVDFFRFSKTALWISNDNLTYERNTSGAQDSVIKGAIYGGLPYIGGGGCGSVYRMMDYIDPETGVLDMENPAANPALFGNHCTSASYWAWGRVINSVGHNFTATILHTNGFLRVGPYTYDDTALRFSEAFNTPMICAKNGMDVMFESYAQLQPADGLVNYTSGGHVLMVSAEPHIEYVAGTDQIDFKKSYVTVIEQGQTWENCTNEAGDSYQMKNGVDVKKSFLQLFETHYIPFTYAEFLGTDPVEKTECSIDLSGDSVSFAQLFSATVTANYGISDAYIVVKDKSGKEIYRHVTRADVAGAMELKLMESGTASFSWGSRENVGRGCTVEVLCQLSTGERPVVYSGKLAN